MSLRVRHGHSEYELGMGSAPRRETISRAPCSRATPNGGSILVNLRRKKPLVPTVPSRKKPTALWMTSETTRTPGLLLGGTRQGHRPLCAGNTKKSLGVVITEARRLCYVGSCVQHCVRWTEALPPRAKEGQLHDGRLVPAALKRHCR